MAASSLGGATVVGFQKTIQANFAARRSSVPGAMLDLRFRHRNPNDCATKTNPNINDQLLVAA